MRWLIVVVLIVAAGAGLLTWRLRHADDAPDLADCTQMPAFDRSCDEDLDCAIGVFEPDCAARVARGIAASQADAFAAAAKACVHGGRRCEAGHVRTFADDGQTANPDRIVVTCRAHTCTTMVVLE